MRRRLEQGTRNREQRIFKKAKDSLLTILVLHSERLLTSSATFSYRVRPEYFNFVIVCIL